MKALAAVSVAVGLIFAFASPKDDTYELVLTGDFDGLLTPCGCTDPMSGGIRRMATALKDLAIPGKTALLVNGGLTKEPGRQSELKSETFAQAFSAMDASAIHVTGSERALGPGALIALSNLAGSALVGRPDDGAPIQPYVTRGPFLIGGGIDSSDAEKVARAAQEAELRPVFLLDGDASQAARIAKSVPSLALVQFRSGGRPFRAWVGGTLTVSPGEKGKQLVRLLWRKGRFVSFSSVDLGPQYSNDPEISRIFGSYLKRVTEERLLESVPRTDGPAFAGSMACGNCHAGAMRIWKRSKHAHALQSLESEGEGTDPDCVKCHVVGLASTAGYRSAAQTPQLANVGCESCHGAGASHAADPRNTPMPKVGPAACAQCHTVEQSPDFQFASRWKLIRH